MKYTVELTERATNDIRQAYEYIRQHGPAHPDDWTCDLERKLGGLEMLPEACGFALENNYSSAAYGLPAVTGPRGDSRRR